MAKTNEELTAMLALDMGLDLTRRLPHAKEVFKWQDIELLPHSSKDTTLCEIYDWSKRNWRTTNDTFIPWIYNNDMEQVESIMEALKSVPKEEALVPNFEFDKESILDLGAGLPELFGIKLSGEIKRDTHVAIKVSNVKKTRISNSTYPGMEIAAKLSAFARDNSRDYRKKIKFEYLSEALFYAEQVEVELKNESGLDMELGATIEAVDVEFEMDTNTKKKMKLSYTGSFAPFGATMVKGKNLF